MPQRILVADDEKKIVDLVSGYLKVSGFEVIECRDGEEALSQARSAKPDCLVLDVNMPGRDGLSVAREARKFSEAPIIFLSALSEETDRIVGLEIGGDDYVAKPFSPRELVARVRAVLRRAPQKSSEYVSHEATPGSDDAESKDVLYRGLLRIDLLKRRVLVNGKVCALTAVQFDILRLLASAPGRVFTRADILDAVFGTRFQGYERTIDAHIKNLRKALGEPAREEGGQPAIIGTVRGVGYRFEEGEPDEA